MNADEFLATVRDDNETALSRLGSSKSLYAETEGDLEPETVFRAAADAEYAASETFGQWADDAAAEEVRETFADFADQERDHYDDDWDAALDAASGAIGAAYDEYTETLEGMGVNPKPVC